MGRVNVIVSDQQAAGTYPQSPLSAEDLALKRRTDLLSWMDAKGFQREMDGNSQMSSWSSRQFQGANMPQLLSPTTTDYPYGGYDPSHPTEFEFRIGMNTSGTNISGFNNRKLAGNQFQYFPTGDVTIAYFARFLTPGNLTLLGGGNSPSAAPAFGLTSTGILRFYSNYQTNTFIATATPAIVDTLYHLVYFKYNATTGQGSIGVDNVIVKTPAALSVSQPYADPKLNIGYMYNGSTLSAGTGWACMGKLIIRSIDDVTLNLYKNVLASRGLYSL